MLVIIIDVMQLGESYMRLEKKQGSHGKGENRSINFIDIDFTLIGEKREAYMFHEREEKKKILHKEIKSLLVRIVRNLSKN